MILHKVTFISLFYKYSSEQQKNWPLFKVVKNHGFFAFEKEKKVCKRSPNKSLSIEGNVT